MRNSFTLNLQNLFANNDSLHLFQLDLKQRLVNWNTKQEETLKKLLELKNSKISLLNISVEEMYAYDLVKAEKLLVENEEVLQTEIVKAFNTTLIIPGYSKIKLSTTKFPNYDGKNKLIGIFGIANFVSSFSLEKSIQYELSTRETECLEYLLNGDTSVEIADKLSISKRTVDDYIDNIKNKLACKDRKEIILKCHKHGFLKKFY